MIKDFLKWLKALNIVLTDDQIDKFSKYTQILIKENKKYNLTSITTEEDIYQKHFYDSLTLSKEINFYEISNIMDIGSGAGFPGIVLKIVYPHLKITLLDSNHKKTDFLKLLINQLSLKDCQVLNLRCEDLPLNFRDYYDVVTARAVAELKIISELAIPFVKEKGYFVAMKSNCEEEIKNSLEILKKIDSSVVSINSFNLPNGNLRTLLKIQKKSKTNAKYPRRYSEIIKNH